MLERIISKWEQAQIWIIGECVSITVIFLGFFMFVWLSNWLLLFKVLASIFAFTTMYSVFTHFILVRYNFMKIALNQTQYSKLEEEIEEMNKNE